MDEFFSSKYKKKKIIEDEFEIKGKKVDLFSYLHDICYAKTGTLSLKDPGLKAFNSYMILKFLSLEEAYLPFVNIMNKYQGNITKEQMYRVLLNLIPKGRKFLKYPKKIEKNEKDIQLLIKYFKCSSHEAQEYLKYDFIRDIDIKIIKEKFGGKKSEI